MFPKENAGTYFIHPVRKGQSPTGKPVVSKGKLVDKVRNLLFKYGERKRPSTTGTDSDASSKTARTDTAGKVTFLSQYYTALCIYDLLTQNLFI